MPKKLVWTAVAAQYKTRFSSEPLSVYFRGADQLTVSRLRKGQIPRLALWHRAVLDREIAYLMSAPLDFLRSSLNYARFSFMAGWDVGEQWAGLGNWRARLVWLTGLLPGAFRSMAGGGRRRCTPSRQPRGPGRRREEGSRQPLRRKRAWGAARSGPFFFSAGGEGQGGWGEARPL